MASLDNDKGGSRIPERGHTHIFFPFLNTTVFETHLYICTCVLFDSKKDLSNDGFVQIKKKYIYIYIHLYFKIYAPLLF